MNRTNLIENSINSVALISSVPSISSQECFDATKVLEFAHKASNALKAVMDTYHDARKNHEGLSDNKTDTITQKQITLLRTLLLNKVDTNTRIEKMREMNHFTKAEASKLIKELIGR